MTPSIADFSQFTALKSRADRNDPAVLRDVARQFEALFLETVLKNMRAAELAEPLFGDSEQMELYRELMDRELASQMASGRGIGFADLLVRQLGGEREPVRPTSPTATANGPQAAVLGKADRAAAPWQDPDSFVRELWPHAERIARRLKVAPEGILAQAALETGWGAHVMPGRDGASSHNLFGIKADRAWTGDSVGRATLEYVDGVARRQIERFRSYQNFSDAFDDYADLIEGDERYASATGSARDVRGFAAALQDGGYATDPEYAAKIVRVLESGTMQSALRKLKIQ